MLSRKSFIITGIFAAIGLTALGKGMRKIVMSGVNMKKGKPGKGLIMWYSQTGNTERVGRAIAAAWKKTGLKVDYGDYRDIDKGSLDNYDIIAVGTPVYYYEVPQNFREWLDGIPHIDGTPIAVFVTFGGEGGNQHNTVCELTELLAKKGGVPAGTAEFSCMSSYALTWSSGNSERVLKYKDRPGADTFSAAEKFALEIFTKISEGNTAEVSGNFSMRNIIKGSPSIGVTKLMITGHRINTEKCISCGKCKRACTVNAINPEEGTVDTGKCIACLGCINNCPAGAVEMKFIGKEVYGHGEFIKRNNIIRSEPSL